MTHFKNCAEVNNWDGDTKLKFLKVRLTGRAQTAFRRLPDDQKGTFDDAVAALTERFEPKSKRDLYVAELLTREKKLTESWGDLAEELRQIATKAYPDLGAAAAEQLALTHYHSCIHDIQLALPVKQKSPTSLHEAVSYTIQIESFLSTCHTQPSINVARAEPTEATQLPADAVTVKPPLDKFTEMVEKFGKRLDNIESTLQRPPQGNHRPPQPCPRDTPVVCFKCHQTGHFAQGCSAPRSPSPHLQRAIRGEGHSPEGMVKHMTQPTGNNTISITPVNPALTLHVDVNVLGSHHPFYVDTGAAVTPMDSSLLKQNGTVALEPVTRHKLVGVSGMPLLTLGSTVIEIKVKGISLQVPVVTVEGLTQLMAFWGWIS